MQLNELFDKDEPVQVTRDAEDVWRAKGMSKSGPVTVGAELINARYNMWEVAFSVRDTTELTGDGNQFEVFAIVANMLKHFYKRQSPDNIFMTAKEANRAKLYERMFKRGGTFKRIVVIPGSDKSIVMASVDDTFPVRRGQANPEFASIQIGGLSLTIDLDRDGEPDFSGSFTREYGQSDYRTILKPEIDKAVELLKGK